MQEGIRFIEKAVSLELEAGNYANVKAIMRELSEILQPEALDAFRVAWLEKQLDLDNPNPISYPAEEVFAALRQRFEVK